MSFWNQNFVTHSEYISREILKGPLDIWIKIPGRKRILDLPVSEVYQVFMSWLQLTGQGYDLLPKS